MASLFNNKLSDSAVILVMLHIDFTFKAVIAFKTEEFLSVREDLINCIKHFNFSFHSMRGTCRPPLGLLELSVNHKVGKVRVLAHVRGFCRWPEGVAPGLLLDLLLADSASILGVVRTDKHVLKVFVAVLLDPVKHLIVFHFFSFRVGGLAAAHRLLYLLSIAWPGL